MCMKHWWNGRRRKDNKSTWRETFSSANFFTTNPQHTGLESKPDLYSDGPATSCLSSGTAKIDICFISELLITTQPIRTSVQLASSYAVNCGFVSNLKITRSVFHCLRYRERQCVYCFQQCGYKSNYTGISFNRYRKSFKLTCNKRRASCCER